MSETGHEFYPTPRDAVLALLESPLLAFPEGRWLEPCAGTGRLVRVVQERLPAIRWTAVEIDPRFDQHLCPVIRQDQDELVWGDFLAQEWPPDTFDLTIMNPPFSLARQFVEHAFRFSRRVMMLQRSAWFAGTKKPPCRDAWLREHCPDKLTLPVRPSFTPDGKTDSSEYAWFDWPTWEPRRVGMHAMLDRVATSQLDLGAGS